MAKAKVATKAVKVKRKPKDQVAAIVAQANEELGQMEAAMAAGECTPEHEVEWTNKIEGLLARVERLKSLSARVKALKG